jgi:hypothetical protein
MMDVEDEHNHMRAAFGLRDRIGQPVALHSNPGQPVIDSKIFSCF